MDDATHSVIEVARRHLAAEDVKFLDDLDADLSAMGLDSLGMVDFILDLEESLSIKFPAEMINAWTFRSVRSVAESVKTLRE